MVRNDKRARAEIAEGVKRPGGVLAPVKTIDKNISTPIAPAKKGSTPQKTELAMAKIALAGQNDSKTP